MDIFQIAAVLVSLTAVCSFINHRYIGLPTTIGVMSIALAASLAVVGLHTWSPIDLAQPAADVLEQVAFDRTLLHGMLAFLLFAGALHVNLDDLAAQKWIITSLATVGIMTSTVLVGGLIWVVLQLLGVPLSLMYCCVFGALISPTDPIAVLGILKAARVPKSLETKITGESLFNDGIGVVIFLVLAEIAHGQHPLTSADVAILFGQEALGGLVLGGGGGGLAYWMLRRVNSYQVEVLITLALVMGVYALAGALHMSGPIAVVIAGLLIGNQGRLLAMSPQTRAHLDTFWELIDEVLNAVLFVLIGMEVLVLTFTWPSFTAGLFAIPIVLCARGISVSMPVMVLRQFREFSPHIIRILTWGGLRGGISVALALSLPAGPAREVIVAMTYPVVVFSVLVQGLTIGPLVRRSRAE